MNGYLNFSSFRGNKMNVKTIRFVTHKEGGKLGYGNSSLGVPIIGSAQFLLCGEASSCIQQQIIVILKVQFAKVQGCSLFNSQEC